jgi:hypothetical protein
MILRVAAGVFLGIIAVLIILKIPDWIQEYSDSSASSQLYGLTPDIVIARCGKPLKDKNERFPTTKPKEPLVMRYMFYKGRLGTVLVNFIEFSQDDGKRAWNLSGVSDVSGLDDYSGFSSYRQDQERIHALPCLATK